MSEKKASHWKNPWVVGIGTTVIAAIVLKVIDAIFNTSILKSMLSWFTNKHTVHGWLIVLIPLLTLLLTYIISRFTYYKIYPKEFPPDTKQRFLRYKEDIFGRILVKWNYKFNKDLRRYQITEIFYYCPKCHAILYNGRCPVCKSSYKKIDEGKIIALIQHRIDSQILNLKPRS